MNHPFVKGDGLVGKTVAKVADAGPVLIAFTDGSYTRIDVVVTDRWDDVREAAFVDGGGDVDLYHLGWIDGAELDRRNEAKRDAAVERARTEDERRDKEQYERLKAKFERN